MKPINQTRNFSVCMHGYTLPMYALYGNVYRQDWYTTDLGIHKEDGQSFFVIHVWRESKKHAGYGHWERTDTRQGFGGIYVRIRDFMQTDAFVMHKVVRCEHRVHKQRELDEAVEEFWRNRAKKRERERRQFERDLREVGCPQGLPTGKSMIYRCRPQAGSDDWEYRVGLTPEQTGYLGSDGISQRNYTGYVQVFEMGQTTAGDACEDGEYGSRSAWETRDHVRLQFNKYDKAYLDNHTIKAAKKPVKKIDCLEDKRLQMKERADQHAKSVIWKY